MRDLRITSEPQAGPEVISFIKEALARHNVAATGDTFYSPLAILLKDGRGAVLGGALGDVWGGWLDLSFLWVAQPVRGRGYGERLLGAAEEEARALGCRGVFLSTFSFQARVLRALRLRGLRRAAGPSGGMFPLLLEERTHRGLRTQRVAIAFS